MADRRRTEEEMFIRHKMGDHLGGGCRFYRRRRYYIAIMAFWGYVMGYGTRVNLSVAIVYMAEFKNITLENGTVIRGQDFEWSPQVQGNILASFFYGYIATQVLGGYLSGIVGGNNVLNLGIAASGLLSLLFPETAKISVDGIVILRVLSGLFQGLTIPAMNAMWARWAPPLERTTLSSIAISGNFLSAVLVMPLCGFVGELFGWEWMFYLFGITSLLWCLLWWFTVWNAPEDDKCIKESELLFIQQTIGERTNVIPKHPWGKIITSMPVWAIILAHTAHNMGLYTVIMYGPKYFYETLHYGIYASTLFTGVSFALCGILIQIGGKVSDILRERKVFDTITVRKIFCCGGFAMQSVIVMFPLFYEERDWVAASLIIAISLGGISWAGFLVNSLDIASPHAAILLGISNTFASIPGIFAPFIIAEVVPEVDPQVSDWIWVWFICSAVYFIALVFFAIFAQGERQSWVFTPPRAN